MSLVRLLPLFLFLTLLAETRPSARGQVFETLFSDNRGQAPTGGLVQASDGNFYGVTYSGGANIYGTIFKMAPDGALTTLASFNGANGSKPRAGLIEGSDGNFYGTAYNGGASDKGTVFKMTPAGALTTLVSFKGTNGSNPMAKLLEGSDGNFYGTTAGGGANDKGTIFRVTPFGELTTIVSFNGNNGRMPGAELIKGRDGNLYGTTVYGGSADEGTIFRVTPSGELTTLVSFNGSNGRSPIAALLEGRDGNFYGTTSDTLFGSDNGTVFKMTPAGALTTLVTFGGVNGRDPRAALVEGSDGNFYGTTAQGGESIYGTVFRITPSGAFTVLVSFDRTTGSRPSGGVVPGRDGNFYGTTEEGGGAGSIFKITPAGALTTLFTFFDYNTATGSPSTTGVLRGDDGNFYGTTFGGGSVDVGTVFKVTAAGVHTRLVVFEGPNGSRPSGLLAASDGNFYGTTREGGEFDRGTVFKITQEGKFTTIFSNSASGNAPTTALVEGSDGSFYGATFSGGASGQGSIYKVTPAGAFTRIASFNGTNGINPGTGLLRGSDGNFYGTTFSGGASNNGTVFKVTPAGVLTTLVSFNGTNGTRPAATLLEGSDGNFYGSTYRGGQGDNGTIFKMTPAGALTTLVFFNSTNGSHPASGMIEGGDGNFYGTTYEGGASGYGTVFRMTPAGELITLHSFDGVVTSRPQGDVILSDGKLYGTAQKMVIWSLSIPMLPAVSTLTHSGVTSSGATLSGLVNANGADATVSFEYGLTPDYGSSVAANPGTVTGTNKTAVSAALSGLSSHTTYFYRLTATNANGSVSTIRGSFTTAGNPPVATNDSFVPAQNDFGAITLSVLENDSDADGDQLTITAVTQGRSGAVTANGTTLTYTPGRGFIGRDSFSYTVSDGFDTAAAQVELRASEPFTRALLSKDSEVPGAGQQGSGILVGSRFKSFGAPSINSAGKIAFTASYGVTGSSEELSVFGFEPEAVKNTLIARRGQVAPGTSGALFSSFKDPLLNGAGDIAFLAALSGGDTTKLNKEGIWVSSASQSSEPHTQLIARTGAQAPGAPEGARWKSFTSVAFSGDGADTDAVGGGWTLAFTAFMAPGAGGVKASNDMGLWIASAEGIVLALREGQKLQIGQTEKALKSFAALMPLSNAPGQGNGITSTGAMAVQASFTDGTQSLLRVSRDSADTSAIAVETIALTGDTVVGASETVAKFGLPTQSNSGAATAWIGTLSGKGNPSAVFQHSQSAPEFLRFLARRGDVVPGTAGVLFSAFKSVTVSDTGSAIFLARVSGKGISRNGDEGLWWAQSSGDDTSPLLLARKGMQPPGVPQGAQWSAFTSMALSEGVYGPLFTARLLSGTKGKAGPGGISSANDQGLWAVDSKGELRLIVQEGQQVSAEGSGTPKTLRSFTVLTAVPGSSTQGRSFNREGRIVYRALCSDGTQAVIVVQLP